MTKLFRKGMLGLAALGLSTAPALAGSFGLIPRSLCGAKCGCVVRPYNAFTPAMCGNPPCIDNAFPNPEGCYCGPGGAMLASGLPPYLANQGLIPGVPGLGSPMAGSPMVPVGMAYQQTPFLGYGQPMPGYGYYGMPWAQGFPGMAYQAQPMMQMAAPYQPVVAPLQPVPVVPAVDNR